MTTNKDVLTKIKPETQLLTRILQRKLSFIGHIKRGEESLDRLSLLLRPVYGSRGRGRPKTRYSDEIVKMCGSMQESNRSDWRRLVKVATADRFRPNCI